MLVLFYVVQYIFTFFFKYTFYKELCVQGAIRLQGNTATSGRVEICNNNEWGSVCENLWGPADALVACRQLGFSEFGATNVAYLDAPDGTGQIWLNNVECSGTESSLFDCNADPLGSHNCKHYEDAGVSCRKYNVVFTRILC